MLVRSKTAQERDSENRWWASLSKNEQDRHLRKLDEEDTRTEMAKTVIFVVAMLALIIYPAAMVVLHLLGLWKP